MQSKGKYREWMAVQIAKSYLYETGLLEVYENQAEQFDFLCIIKSNLSNVFAVDVKASQYSRTEIVRMYKEIRENYLRQKKIPVLMLYINYIDRTGYFEFIQNQLSVQLNVLSTINLKAAIEGLRFV